MTMQLVQPPQPRQAKVVHNLTWEQLEEIDRSLEDFPGVRLAYLDGTLEIRPISPEHEDFKSTIARLLETYLDEANIRFYRWGGPSYGNKELGARNEPDESYNLESRKPFPDLVIEVVISSGGVNKLEGYRRMGVPEVWFWEGGVLQIHHLRTTGYEQIDRSELLPSLPLDLFCRYVTYYDQYDAVREFRQSLRESFG